MTFDPVSFALGVVAAYVFSCVLCIAICIAELQKERKGRDEAVDQLMARVAVRCIERPTNVRSN